MDFSSILIVCIKYSMCDLIRDVIGGCVLSCDTGNINVYNNIVVEDQNKSANMEIKEK